MELSVVLRRKGPLGYYSKRALSRMFPGTYFCLLAMYLKGQVLHQESSVALNSMLVR